jgi:hypothetical protein
MLLILPRDIAHSELAHQEEEKQDAWDGEKSIERTNASSGTPKKQEFGSQPSTRLTLPSLTLIRTI